METCLKCPITALKATQDILLSGQGSNLVIYRLNDNSKILSAKIFTSSRIHKFIECTDSPGLWLVIGGKHVRLIRLQNVGDTYEVQPVCEEKVFRAWLWDAHWLTKESMLLITSYNTVLYWNPFHQKTSVVSSCQQQCILYSASFSFFQDDIVVAVGTVFNKVLLWKPEYCENAQNTYKDVCKTFIGHQGVIFRIRFHPSESQLLSVSDDRSIRLWSLIDESCLQVLYGHTARVWDAQYTGQRIVSVGEDAMCILWNLQGNVVKKYGGHKGKSIWSMQVHGDVIITGGGDCAIRVWHMDTQQLEVKGAPLELSLPKHEVNRNDDDYPRTVKYLNHDQLIVFSDTGILWKYDISSSTWNLVHQDGRFSSYCCLDMSNDLVVIGNLKGLVKVLDLRNPSISSERQLFDGKVFSIFWLAIDTRRFVLVCGPSGKIKVLLVNTEGKCNLTEQYDFVCPPSKQCWISAVDVVSVQSDFEADGVVFVCGDRRGSIHVFLPNYKDPHHSILGVHGKTGVTQVSSQNGFIYSTGRDGSFRKYKYDAAQQQLQLIDKQKACKGMDWIEGVWFKNDSDIVIYGFYMQSHFAAWNYETNEVLFKIKCGGGYRSWDVVFPNKNEKKEFGFSYVKGTQLNVVQYDWKQTNRDQIIEDSLHGREVLAVKVLGKQTHKDCVHWLLVTCSEDTTINFIMYDELKLSTRLFHTVVGHIGGVKDICFVPCPPTKEQAGKSDPNFHGYFVSSGSRTSLKFWRLSDNVVEFMDGTYNLYSNELTKEHEFSCSLLSEIYNPETKLKMLKLKDRTLIDDMRYLSCDAILLSSVYPDTGSLGNTLCCACACSDGVVRIYMVTKSKIQLLTSLDCDNHCVLAVKMQTTLIGNQTILFASATNGLIYLWNITSLLGKYNTNIFAPKNEYSYNELDNNEMNLGMTNGCDISPNETDSGKSSYEHINKNKYKFHDLNTPFWNFEGDCLRVSAHQSGVNAIDVRETNEGLTIASGGDDSCICVTRLIYKGDGFEVGAKCMKDSAHISSLSAIYFVNDRIIVSTSIDQRIKFWWIGENNISQIHEIRTDIADVSNMEIWLSSDTLHLAVTGVGLEILNVAMKELLESASLVQNLPGARKNSIDSVWTSGYPPTQVFTPEGPEGPINGT